MLRLNDASKMTIVTQMLSHKFGVVLRWKSVAKEPLDYFMALA